MLQQGGLRALAAMSSQSLVDSYCVDPRLEINARVSIPSVVACSCWANYFSPTRYRPRVLGSSMVKSIYVLALLSWPLRAATTQARRERSEPVPMSRL